MRILRTAKAQREAAQREREASDRAALLAEATAKQDGERAAREAARRAFLLCHTFLSRNSTVKLIESSHMYPRLFLNGGNCDS